MRREPLSTCIADEAPFLGVKMTTAENASLSNDFRSEIMHFIALITISEIFNNIEACLYLLFANIGMHLLYRIKHNPLYHALKCVISFESKQYRDAFSAVMLISSRISLNLHLVAIIGAKTL